MNRDHCLLDRDGYVLTVTLNRPEAKNALSSGMLAGMYRAWRMLDDDPGLRVAILTGRGDVFCAAPISSRWAPARRTMSSCSSCPRYRTSTGRRSSATTGR